jgi:hypothetical protein
MRLARSRTTAHLLAAGGVGVLVLVLAGCSSGTPTSSSTSTSRPHSSTSRSGTTTTTARPSTTTSTTVRPSTTTTSLPPSSSTTTTAPPSTTTTAAVPALVPLTGATPLYQPSQFNYTQDGTGSVNNLTWSTWSSAGATGTGTINLNNRVPTCASGTVSGYPATVTLSGASQTSQGYVFTQMTISAPGSPDPSQSFTIPR